MEFFINQSFVTVIRKGIPQNVNENDLHLGDLVLVQTGDIVPADLKLVEARSLEVDEFDITGELMPVVKTIASEDVFVYMGCRIIRGSAKGVVVALGNDTVFGRILNQATAENPTSRFRQFRLRQLWILLFLIPAFCQSISQSTNRQMTIVLYFFAGVLLLLFQEDALILSFLLKREQQKNKKKNIFIRNIEIIPHLDEIDIICFDKTGVLTTRQMEITKFFMYSSLTEVDARCSGFDEDTQALIKTASVLCTDVSFFEKTKFANPVDYALISFAQRAGVDFAKISSKFQRIFDMPFDSEKRYMYCGYETEDQKQWYFLKGDPDLVLLQCKDYFDENGGKGRIDFGFQSKIRALSQSISQKGDTAIAMAIAVGDVAPQQNEYTFLCLVEFENTLQENAKDVVERMIEKGIRPLLLTGDKSEAAVKIAHACGITQNGKASLSGNVIDRMTLDEVGRQAEYCSIFSRLLPSQKAAIIRQLQNKGHRVMMVGDGPNDGIALNIADIGISFQTESSPIARRFSSILLNHLNNLPELIQGAYNLKKRMRQLRYFRIVISIVLFITLYISAFQK